MQAKPSTSFDRLRYLLHNTENHDLMTDVGPSKWQQRNIILNATTTE